MHFKLIIALIDDEKTDEVIEAAKAAGATGASIVNNARGEGMNRQKTFLGLSLTTQRDMILFLVEEHLSRKVLETISDIGDMETPNGAGIAFTLDVEDAVGLTEHIQVLTERVEDQL
jgi:nitrogen regulatory protein PII